MNQRRVSYRRILLPAVLSLILAAETIVVVGATSVSPVGPTGSRFEAPNAATVQTGREVAEAASSRGATRPAGQLGNPNLEPNDGPTVAQPEVVEPEASARPQVYQAVQKPKSVAKSAPVSTSGGSNKSTSTSSSTTYKGRNRMWFPALGINRSVTGFSCSNSSYPGDRVYRWGCAGKNNVYLFGHAHSVFKPLHDAYVRGRLKKGMKVTYADSSGKVRTYKIAWWKLTTPEKGTWAYAAQTRPSMTLQTCVGARSQYRLIVRLYLDS